MGFQFVHLEAYSRKSDKGGRSVSWVLDEADREPGAAPHVEHPSPPVVVFGKSVPELREMHDAEVDAARVTTSNGRTRKIRQDQQTLLTVVASHPATMEDVRTDPKVRAEYDAWELRTVAWLREMYGVELVTVIRHEDETHPHLHAYILPSDLRARERHPGVAAKLAVKASPQEGEDAKAVNRRGDVAYKAAMREWQDSYWQSVGLPSGLTRLGPARRRLSREAWKAEQTQAQAVLIAETKAAEYVQRTKEQGSAYVERVKADAAEIRKVAEAQAEEAKAAHDRAVRIESQARAIMKRAKAEASRILADVAPLRTLGGRLRSLWDGLRASSIEKRVRADVASELAELSRVASAEKAARRDAERRASSAEASVKDLTFSGSLASREVSRLSARISSESAPDVENECSRKPVGHTPGGVHGG